MFELKPTGSQPKSNGGVFSKGRLLLGRTESCDLMVNHDSVSAVHAVMEIFDDRAIIYDMNSTNGTYVNDDKVVVKELHFGDTFRLADIEFEFLIYSPTETLPPVLDTLEPSKGEASVKLPPTLPPELPSTPKALPKTAPSVTTEVPSIIYPSPLIPRLSLVNISLKISKSSIPSLNTKPPSRRLKSLSSLKNKFSALIICLNLSLHIQFLASGVVNRN